MGILCSGVGKSLCGATQFTLCFKNRTGKRVLGYGITSATSSFPMREEVMFH